MNINKKKRLLLIADRGRSDVSVRLGFLAQKIVKRKWWNLGLEGKSKVKLGRNMALHV